MHRLVRGASLHGLTAIPPKNGRFLRPLLRVTRRQVEQYLESLGQTYVTDSTNLTDAYTRNRIRHQVIPALEQLNPSVERTVSYTLRSLRREDDFLHQQAQAAYAKCHTGKNTLSGLETLHEALQFRCIAMLLEEAGISCEAPLLERLAALARQGGRWNLSGAVYAVGKSGTLTIETVQLPEPLPEAIPLQMGENRLFSGFVLHARLETVSPAENVANIHKKFANACLDYDKIKGEIFLRPRQSGDRMAAFRQRVHLCSEKTDTGESSAGTPPHGSCAGRCRRSNFRRGRGLCRKSLSGRRNQTAAGAGNSREMLKLVRKPDAAVPSQ